MQDRDRNQSMAEIEDNVDRELFRNFEKLRQLRIEHRDLDEIISRLALDMHVDEIQMKRLKKQAPATTKNDPWAGVRATDSSKH